MIPIRNFCFVKKTGLDQGNFPVSLRFCDPSSHVKWWSWFSSDIINEAHFVSFCFQNPFVSSLLSEAWTWRWPHEHIIVPIMTSFGTSNWNTIPWTLLSWRHKFWILFSCHRFKIQDKVCVSVWIRRGEANGFFGRFYSWSRASILHCFLLPSPPLL